MSEPTAAAPDGAVVPAPPALPDAPARLRAGLLPENPVFRQLLGMCPTLAVTAALDSALTLALATAAVLLLSNVITSLLRGGLRPHLRILVFTITIAALVTVVDRGLAAFLPDMSRRLGPYVPLIIVNCILISRAEVCASKQGPVVAAADALGQGGGFVAGLLALGAVRELIGAGSLFGRAVLPEAWPGWVIMALPPGAFFTLGLLIAAVNWASARPGAPEEVGRGL